MTVNQVAATGGEVATLDVGVRNPVVMDISPETSELLVAEEINFGGSSVWSVPLPAGSPRYIITDAGGALWTPDGHLVFSRENDLYIAEHDGANPRKFAVAPDLPRWVRFSPDRSRIRFEVASIANSTSSLYEARSDGSNMHPLFPGWNNPPIECCANWTADGRYFIFRSIRDGDNNIWIVPDNISWLRKVSREPIQLTTGPLQFDDPLISKDGKKLSWSAAYNRAQSWSATMQNPEISFRFSEGCPLGTWNSPATRSGSPISATPRTHCGAAKPTVARVFSSLTLPCELLWPTGRQMGNRLYSRRRCRGKRSWQVFLISRDGGTSDPVTTEDVWETDPTWSNDGSTLAFGHYDLLHSEKTFIELFNVKTRQLSHLPDSQGVFGPRWSPDGRYILAGNPNCK